MTRRPSPQARLLAQLRVVFPQGWWARLDLGLGGQGLPHIVGLVGGQFVAVWIRSRVPSPRQERIRRVIEAAGGVALVRPAGEEVVEALLAIIGGDRGEEATKDLAAGAAPGRPARAGGR